MEKHDITKLIIIGCVIFSGFIVYHLWSTQSTELKTNASNGEIYEWMEVNQKNEYHGDYKLKYIGTSVTVMEGAFKRGFRDGEWTFWSADGKPMMKMVFDEGKISECTRYSEKGEKTLSRNECSYGILDLYEQDEPELFIDLNRVRVRSAPAST